MNEIWFPQTGCFQTIQKFPIEMMNGNKGPWEVTQDNVNREKIQGKENVRRTQTELLTQVLAIKQICGNEVINTHFGCELCNLLLLQKN